MWLRPDQQKVHKMLTESIMMLCRNGLDYTQEFSVEGLLGITLDSKEVFLVNIKECVRAGSSVDSSQPQARDPENSRSVSSPGGPQHEHTQSAPYMSSSYEGHGPRDSHPSPDHHHGHHHSEGIVSCPLTPMVQPFKSPFRRMRGRRKFFGMECRGLRRKFSHPHNRMMHAMMEAHKQMASEHMDGFGMPFAKKRLRDDEGNMAQSHSKSEPGSSDQTADFNQQEGGEPRVKVEPVLSGFAADADRELTIDESTSLRYGGEGDLEDYDGAVVSTRTDSPWSYDPEGQLQQPATPTSVTSVDTTDTMSETFEEPGASNVDQGMLTRVKTAIMKEDGCFVTTRMLCRRYSAYFKSHIVIEAMKAITVPAVDPQHIGMFRNLKERSKVFYKCPPQQMNPETLKSFNMTPRQYEESYYKVPKPKGMHTPRWDVFVQFVLESSPYGPINPLEFNSSFEHIEDVEPGNSMDEFDLQQYVAHSDGCFISSRILCRRLTKHYKVFNVIRAMKAMTRKPGDKHYIGQFVKVSERIKVFFKCPPRLLGSEVPQLYGLSVETYGKKFYSTPRPWDGSVSNWDSYLENIVSRYPYPLEDFPLDSCDVSPDVVDRIRSLMGPGSSAGFQGQGTVFPEMDQSQDIYEAGPSSTMTLDRIRSMLSGPGDGESSGATTTQDNSATSEKAKSGGQMD